MTMQEYNIMRFKVLLNLALLAVGSVLLGVFAHSLILGIGVGCVGFAIMPEVTG